MNTESIITTVLSAAGFLQEPLRALASQSLRDVYAATKYYLRRKFSAHPEAAQALDLATEKPSSAARKALLVEESEPANLSADPDLVRLIEQLACLMPARAEATRQFVTVEGTRNQVQVAGRDLIVAAHHVSRNEITPDDRHLAREQRTALRRVIHELAERMTSANGGPNLAAVHRMLQRRYGVASYLLIPRERYADALAFLQRQRVIRRGTLVRRNPAAFCRDLFRSIYARAGELGWSREAVYDFARAQFQLTRPVTSLKQLEVEQLRSLADRLHRKTFPAAK
jgi:hypothetical protein